MSFDRPAFMVCFAVVGFLIVLEIIHYGHHKKTLKMLMGAGGAIKLQKDVSFRFALSALCFYLFCSSCIIALAGPRWGTRSVMEYRRGVDTVFAFDVSRSMEVRDTEPSRIGRASAIARDAVLGLGDVRIAAAIGKGKGVLALPLTWDTNAVLAFLDALLTESITGTGTNLGSLIDSAGDAFLDAFPSKHLVVLFSDGEDLSNTFQAAVDRAKLSGQILVSVGLGTEKGGPVPQNIILDPASGEPILEGAGKAIISSRNTEALKNAAERSGGIYIDGNSPAAAGEVIGYIQSLAPKTGISSYHVEPKPQWRVFALAALGFFALSKLAEKRMRGKLG
jgi:Ca-activated chloride channel family protein